MEKKQIAALNAIAHNVSPRNHVLAKEIAETLTFYWDDVKELTPDQAKHVAEVILEFSLDQKVSYAGAFLTRLEWVREYAKNCLIARIRKNANK